MGLVDSLRSTVISTVDDLSFFSHSETFTVGIPIIAIRLNPSPAHSTKRLQ